MRLFFFLFFFFINLPNTNASDVVYVDLDFLLKKSTIGNKILFELNEENDKLQLKFEKKEIELNNEQNEIKKIKNVISNEEYNNKISLFKKKINLYNEEKNKEIREFENKKNNELDKFFKLLNKVMTDYMKNNSIEVIFDKSSIVIANQKNDISQKILEIINQNDQIK